MLPAIIILRQALQNTPQRSCRVKHRLVKTDAAPVFIRSALKQRCFNQGRILSCVFFTSQFLKKLLLISSFYAFLYVIAAKERKLSC